MGRTGRPPKPTAQHKLEGTFRPDRVPAHTFTPELGAPARPEWLDAEGRREWDRVVPVLVKAGVLAPVDGGRLADYCAAHSLAVRASRKYQREGLMVKPDYGPKVTHPMIKIAREARAQANRLGIEFGLTPASRSRLDAPPPVVHDEVAEFLGLAVVPR
jgi:P27 family predicted phage terminase small subunit